jgi:hypothetical protein
MIDLGNLAQTLGLRRKKSVVERIQDVAEDMMDRVRPGKPSPMERVARMSSSIRKVDMPEVRLPEMRLPDVRMPNLPDMHMPEMRMPDMRMPDVRLPDMKLPDVRLPDLHASERIGDAAGRVRHGAAATGTAAVGVAAGIGGFFGALFSGLWSLTTFVVKASILAGVAYAGWHYLQSRKTQQSWSGSPGATDSPNYSSSMYGSVAPQEATTAR